MKLIGAFIAIGVLLATGVASAQVVVYSQPNDYADGPYSDGVPGQYYSTRIAENFLLTNAANRDIVEISWWGCPEGSQHFDLDAFESWVVKIYHEGTDGLPGELIFDQTFLKDDTNPVETGNYNMNGAPEYAQYVELASPVTLYIDEKYWISIGMVTIEGFEFDDGWNWSGNWFEGDDLLAADQFDGNGYSTRTGDVAFALAADPSSGCPRMGCESGDIDGSCVVDLNDLAQLLGMYGACDGDPNYDANADFDSDGCIDLDDLAALLAAYGHDCNE